jgi:hypothetical protein
MSEQAFAQVDQISVGVTPGGDPLVHLKNVQAIPRNLLEGQGTEHLPRSVASADSHNKSALSAKGRPGLRGDELGSRPGDRIGIRKNSDLHE